MGNFFINHFEGIVALVISVGIPIILVVFSQWEKNIKYSIEKQINGLAKRLDMELNKVNEKIIVLRETIKTLEQEDIDNLQFISAKLKDIESDIIKLEEIKNELAGTKELLLIQNKALSQQFADFKEFLTIFIKKNEN